MTIVQTITKNVLKRAWNDIEPKVLSFLATGLSAALVIKAGEYAGVTIDPAAAVAIAAVIAGLAGYLKSSTVRVLPFVPIEVPVPVIVAPTPPVVVAPVPAVVTIIPEVPAA